MTKQADKIKRFDFKKKAKSPGALLTFVKHTISTIDMKCRDFKLEKRNMEDLEGSYLLLITHSSMVDLNVMLKAAHPNKVNNVMTIEGFRDYTEPLMRYLGVIGTRKFIRDIHLIRNIRYCIHELKNVFALFPEARYSLDGCTSFLPESLGKLVRILEVPVVVLMIHGNFISNPQWNKIGKKNHVEAIMTQIITAEQAKELPVEKINEIIQENFQYDDFAWQYENKIRIDHPQRARGLHSILYKCPACKTESKMYSEGTRLWCEECKKVWEMDEYGRMHALEGETEFEHIPDWTKWERQCVREEIENGTYYFEDTVRVETLPNAWKFYKHGEGHFVHSPEGFKLKCTCYGEERELEWKSKNQESIHIEYDYKKNGDCIDISVPDESYWCYFTKRDVITKLSFAAEELYKLNKR